jgi:hypothetical protein
MQFGAQSFTSSDAQADPHVRLAARTAPHGQHPRSTSTIASDGRQRKAESSKKQATTPNQQCVFARVFALDEGPIIERAGD